MWDCEHCGTQAITGDLGFCPGCLRERSPKESEVTEPSEEKSSGAFPAEDSPAPSPPAKKGK